MAVRILVSVRGGVAYVQGDSNDEPIHLAFLDYDNDQTWDNEINTWRPATIEEREALAKDWLALPVIEPDESF